MKTTTFAILAIAATAILGGASDPAEAKKDQAQYEACLADADANGAGFIEAMNICLELMDTPDQSENASQSSIKQQRLKLRQSQNRPVFRMHNRIGADKVRRY